MEELQVIVQQQPGTIKWNFEDLKTALQEEMQVYESMVYDDGAIKIAKQDVAMLRKLRKSVEDRRKEIKAKCLEPYNVIEAQAKELTGLIDRPINMIAEQVQEYEDQQRAARKAKILEYMSEAFSPLPPVIAKKAQLASYDSRWENATAKESEWKAAIDEEAKKVSSEINIIEHGESNEEFRNMAMKTYSVNLSLTDAMDKLQELHHQQEVIIEQQRKKEEERKRREAEAAAREEAARIAAQAQKTEEQKSQPEEPVYHAPTTQNIEPEKPHAMQPEPVTMEKKSGEPVPDATIYLYDASDVQIKKVLDYIRFLGIKWRMVQ